MVSYINLFFKSVIHKYPLILSMAKREVASQYAGSFLGVVWSFVQPFVMILVFWFVFSIGFRVRPMNDVPFVVWLTAGMAPWFVFSNIIVCSTGSVVGKANLIKKTLFPSEILPVVQTIAGIFNHFIFLIILFGLILFMRMAFSFFFLQILYYLVCVCFLALGISWISAAVNVFMRDVTHMVGVLLQVGFWVTPIFWDINMMSANIQFYLKLNPVYYIVQGYRESVIFAIPFWNHPLYTVYFWCITVGIFLTGLFVFYKLKPQFPDVL